MHTPGSALPNMIHRTRGICTAHEHSTASPFPPQLSIPSHCPKLHSAAHARISYPAVKPSMPNIPNRDLSFFPSHSSSSFPFSRKSTESKYIVQIRDFECLASKETGGLSALCACPPASPRDSMVQCGGKWALLLVFRACVFVFPSFPPFFSQHKVARQPASPIWA